MNNQFEELPQEKQQRIIQSGIEYFGKYGYKKTITDDIAAKAGISKGLLFYYFKNKKSFYLYLYDYCENLMYKHIDFNEIKDIDDFFELLDYAAKKKMKLISQYPYLFNFCIRAFYSHKENISKEINLKIQQTIDHTFDKYFQFVDFSKFKDDINPREIYNMLLWMSEGYILNKQRNGKKLEVNDILDDFQKWQTMFKKISYKEEK